jgi:sulfur carrier protein
MNALPITLNGHALALPPGSTVADVVAQVDVLPTAVATAVNGHFVARTARDQYVLCAGDAVFTFQPIVGG